MKILFICMSNICRSPYCEYVFRHIVENDEILKENIEWVKSSAVFNKSRVINSKAILALRREGFEEDYILAHRPTYKWGKGRKYFEEADIIIGMTRSNAYFLPRKYRGKFVLLSQLASGEYRPIPDPVLIKDQNKYYAAMDEIKNYLVEYAKILKDKFMRG
ncbi:MAG: hypothetical protein K2O95_04640 [Clostridia bacterium]|nr:hypothetical protein [Clostridia bacterium]